MNDTFPEVAIVREAFRKINYDITPKQRKMLEAHCGAPGQRLTATELAAAADYKDYTATNLQYGRLGQMLGDALQFRPTMRRADGEPVWTNVLAVGELPDRTEDGHFVWTLRPQILEALEGLPWGIKRAKPASA